MTLGECFSARLDGLHQCAAGGDVLDVAEAVEFGGGFGLELCKPACPTLPELVIGHRADGVGIE